MTNYLKIVIFIFAIIPFSIIYFCWLFGFYDALKEFLEKVFWFIIFSGLAYKYLFVKYMDWCMTRSTESSPTLSTEVAENASESPLEQKKDDNQGQSRAANEFDFGKYKPGSNEAAHAYKNSDEHKNTQFAIRKIDEILKDAERTKVSV